MQHSYEGLDRGGRFSRARILAPFAHRDYSRPAPVIPATAGLGRVL